jgi:Putative zinc-finger
MNRSPQLDLHPDADSLNAFVEHVLADPEREQVLAHIAVCSRCRQVVYLAQEAAAEVKSPAPVTVAAPHAATLHKTWFRNWQVAWGAAAACAAIIMLAITLNLRQKTPATELAKAAPAENERIQQPVSEVQKQPEAAQPAARADVQVPGRHIAPKAAPGISKFAPLRTQPEALSAQASSATSQTFVMAAPSATTATVDVPHVQLNAAELPPITETISKQATLSLDQVSAQSNDASAAAQLALRKRKIAGTTMGLMNARNASVTEMKNTGPLVVAGQAQSAHAAAATMKPGSQVRLEAGAGTTYFNGTIGPESFSITDMAVARNAMHTMLPNGLTAVSTAASQHHLLAIDAIGNLFVSNNSGSNWELVSPQWIGHAVQVRSHPILSNSEARMASPENKVQAATGSSNATEPSILAIPSTPTAIFEIVNDSAAVWTSADGKTWKAK